MITQDTILNQIRAKNSGKKVSRQILISLPNFIKPKSSRTAIIIFIGDIIAKTAVEGF
jgi:hypothetical protein